MSIEDARSTLYNAQSLYNELVNCVCDHDRYMNTMSELFELAHQLGDYVSDKIKEDFVSGSTKNNDIDVADFVMEMIKNDYEAELFFSEQNEGMAI